MSGLNDAARAVIASKNIPSRHGPDLAALHTVVMIDNAGELNGVGALDHAEIRRLYVLPNAQRRGIGSAILVALEEQARQTGLTAVFVQASPSSVTFYEMRGYRFVRNEQTVNDDAVFEHVRMEKSL
jgi:N-acetylglutamate synthase-like GNAT family acetyltransferase